MPVLSLALPLRFGRAGIGFLQHRLIELDPIHPPEPDRNNPFISARAALSHDVSPSSIVFFFFHHLDFTEIERRRADHVR